jgi:D-sedoheptulose 7-phosphate isomerase
MPSEPIRAHFALTLRAGAELRLRLLESGMENLVRATEAVASTIRHGGKLFLFGNGGSAADAQHIATEFVCRFKGTREPLPALSLATDTSALTAIGNDYGFDQIFARQLLALGTPADIVIAISTSGASPNVLAGVRAARRVGMRTIGFSGGDGGRLARLVEIPLVAPSKDTALIQECHITLGHLLCAGVEMLLKSTKHGKPAEKRNKTGAAA